MAEEGGKKNINALRTFAADAKGLQGASPVNAALVIPAKDEYASYENEEGVSADPTLTRINAEAEKIVAPTHESFFAQKGNTAIDRNSVEDGEIIRETKHKRFRLVPAMAHATTAWFTGQKVAYDAYRHPYHPIEKAEARKEVIKEAVEKSAIAPKEDFKTVVERLKKVERKPLQTGLSLKEKTEIPKPQWSYTTDAHIDEIHTDQDESVPAPQMPPTTPPQKEEPPVIAKVSVPEKIEPAPLVEKEVLPEVTAAPILAPVPLVPTPEPPKVQAKKPKDPSQPVPQRTAYTPSPYAQSRARNRFLTFTAIAVVLFASIAGVSVSIFIFKKDTGTAIEKVATYEVPTLIEGNTQAIPLPDDRGVLLEAFNASLKENNTILQLYTMREDAGGARPASAEETLSVLAPKISGSFSRSIQEIAFGGAAQDPFIIMKVTSFDIAFAGMLEWERTMSSDLAPFFGDPVVITFDPSARTDTQVREAFFKDMIASNKNARLLLDQNGNERIIYTFVDQNTILITKTKETLDVLLPRIQ